MTHSNSPLSILKAETFFFDVSDFRTIIGSQWPVLGPRLWVTYRLLAVIYFLGILIWDVIIKFPRDGWVFFAFLTNWTIILFVIVYGLKLVCCFKYYSWLTAQTNSSKPEKGPLLRYRAPWILKRPEVEMPTILQVTWFLYYWALQGAFATTVMYMKEYIAGRTPVSFTELNFQLHGMNLILITLDMFLSAQPVFLAHILHALTLMAIYFTFNAFYFVLGGKGENGSPYLYDFLDWRKPSDIMVPMIIYLTLTGCAYHIVFFLVSFLRQWIRLCCSGPKEELKYMEL